MSMRPFGMTESGEEVTAVAIAGGGLRAEIITYGAVLRDLRLDGVGHPLVLGLETLAGYQRHSPYFGAIVGRCANRIANGRFVLDGSVTQLGLNESDS